MHYSGENAFTLDELYLLCTKFIKEKEGKAFHLSYKDRLQLSALCKQVTHGPYKPDTSPGVGWLNVVGNDRKATWQSLGDLSRDRAQERFVEILDKACPLLGPYLEAHINEKKEAERRQKEEAEARALEAEREKQRQQQEAEAAERERQQRKLAEEAAVAAEQAKRENARTPSARVVQVPAVVTVSAANKEDASYLSRRHQQESQIRSALNQQTAVQFRQYAAEQHPGDALKQEELILQLQEQHFHQYMTQVYQQQLRHQEDLQHSRQQQQQQQQQSQVMQQARPNSAASAALSGSPELAAAALVASEAASAGAASSGADSGKPLMANGNQVPAAAALAPSVVPMAAPSMWTHKQLAVAEFKAGLTSDADAKLKIGPGEVVTVRVPTHEEGACIVWEFASDHYDIGFGVYFEWTISPSDRVTVHISESSDEDEEELEPEAEGGRPRRHKAHADRAVDEIIPVYRRDCHQEVYCGSHQYPGRGVYLLKFDNSYSLWRSKWLYYRVYYTK